MCVYGRLAAAACVKGETRSSAKISLTKPGLYVTLREHHQTVESLLIIIIGMHPRQGLEMGYNCLSGPLEAIITDYRCRSHASEI